MDFDDKCVMVTGATGNLGRAVAKAFADRNARLVLIGSRPESLRRAFGADPAVGDDARGGNARGDGPGGGDTGDGGRRMLAAVDLLDAPGLDAVVADAVARFGRIDVLCNLAGAFRMGKPVHESEDADWQFLFDANVRTALHATRAVVPHMLSAGGGRIVNVGALAAQKGAARMGAYVASKAALQRLTDTLSAELRGRSINVNCVLPSVIDSPENRAAMPQVDPSRWVAPQDLANVIVFLASDAARAVHGIALPVTGSG